MLLMMMAMVMVVIGDDSDDPDQHNVKDQKHDSQHSGHRDSRIMAFGSATNTSSLFLGAGPNTVTACKGATMKGPISAYTYIYMYVCVYIYTYS